MKKILTFFCLYVPFCLSLKITPPNNYLQFLDKYKHGEYYNTIREISKEEALSVVKDIYIESIETDKCIQNYELSRQWILNNIDSDNHLCFIVKNSVLFLCRKDIKNILKHQTMYTILSVDIIVCIDFIILYVLNKTTLLETLHGFQTTYNMLKPNTCTYIQTYNAEYNNNQYLSKIKKILKIYNIRNNE